MDTLFINGLEINTIIGVYEWERQLPQILIADITVGTNFSRAIMHDNIRETIDYAELVHTIRDSVLNEKFTLLESLAEFIAKIILDDFSAEYTCIRLTKPGILKNVKEVGIQIERHKKDVIYRLTHELENE